MSNPNALRFYKKATESLTCYMPHNLILSHNLQQNYNDDINSDSVFKCSQINTLRSTNPIPISNPLIIDLEDSILKSIEEKKEWKRKIKILKGSHKQSLESKKGIKVSSNGSTEVSMLLLNITKQLKNDPDTFYDSYYNWYMSGNGNLCIDLLSNTCFKSVNNVLYVQKFINNKMEDNKQDVNLINYSCKNEKLIHETLVKNSSNTCITGLRQKNAIHLCSFKEDDNHSTIEKISSIKTDIPITSFAFDLIQSILHYVCVDNIIRTYDIEIQKCIEHEQTSTHSTKDNWSGINMFDENTIILTNKDTINVLDLRKTHESIKVSPFIKEDCDLITASKLNENMNYLLLGTVHNIYLCDTRYLKNNKSVITKWTHGFKLPPLYIKTNYLDGKEVVTIGSQLPDEQSIIDNPFYASYTTPSHNLFEQHQENEMNDSNISYQQYLPYCLPSINTTFKNVKKMGICLNPTLNFPKRFNMSKSGTALCNINDNLQLLTLNAIGDVYSQIIFSDHDTIEIDEYEHMKLWSKKICLKKSHFTVSNRVDMNQLQHMMKKPNFPKVTRLQSHGFLTANKSWKQSLSGLNEYSDMWANELLSIWDIQDENKQIDNSLPPPVDTKFRIDSWMQQFPLESEDYNFSANTSTY